jgi:hypothetical protein
MRHGMRTIALAVGFVLTGGAVFVLAKYGDFRRGEAKPGMTRPPGERPRCPTREDLVLGGYVDEAALVDPWGTSVAIHCTTDGGIVIRSAGRDRLFNTADDITEEP